MSLPSIADVAAKAIETPKDCTETDVMRLGLFFVEHAAHVRWHQETQTPLLGRMMGPSLVDRLGPRPQPLGGEGDLLPEVTARPGPGNQEVAAEIEA